MCRTKIFLSTLAAVANETEIKSSEIISTCRRAEVVDARCILAYFLLEQGLNSSEVALLVHVTPRRVRRLRRLYDVRREIRGNLIKANAEAIRTQLGIK